MRKRGDTRKSVCLCNAKRNSTQRNHVCNPTVDCVSFTSSLDIAVSQYRENRIYVSMGDSHLCRQRTKKREKTRTVVAQGRARSSRYRSWDVSVKLDCQTVSSSPGSNEPVRRSAKFNSELDPFPFSPSFYLPSRFAFYVRSHFWIRGQTGGNPQIETSPLPPRSTICAVRFLFIVRCFLFILLICAESISVRCNG